MRNKARVRRMFFFFEFFENIILCFGVAIMCDLVHDVEAIFHLYELLVNLTKYQFHGITHILEKSKRFC